MSSKSSGSSPRVRGKRLGRTWGGGYVQRIIPARAGQTRTTAAPPHPGADHPRACGANVSVFLDRRGVGGSSPRVRGKHLSRILRIIITRIIPARAGQTKRPVPAYCLTADHPRACGANSARAIYMLVVSGSSPRVRGKRWEPTRRTCPTRIIPARAGQTRGRRCTANRTPDHPRACGANPHRIQLGGGQSGSSPRVRGKHLDDLQSDFNNRIIPARAGQTRPPWIIASPETDHPRACGANRFRLFCVRFFYGSSPRVRGKQSDFMRKLLSAGPSIIGFAQWLQSSCYCSCFQSSAKTPISRGTTPTSLFLGFQNSITLLLLT